MDQSAETAAAVAAGRNHAASNDNAGRALTVTARVEPDGNGDIGRRDRPHLALDALLLPALGCTRLCKNSETVIELQGLAPVDCVSLADAERLALAEPDEEWSIHMVNLLDERHYRREGTGLWRLYALGYGLS